MYYLFRDRHMFGCKKHRCLKGADEMRVYTFQLPKMVSSFARKCLQLFQREERKPVAKKKRRKSKMPS
ncbi:hypothetical protein SAMN04488126_10793 [Bhargavaea beijingensis]|uniref:Uncharacterized protein n=2 Tax=Bhargavaea beijingensis TaxID=426756 RepID=A0A1G7C9A3_9BACL|nr:hypothetical protein SAMN04488126_10793 [Bhargavaea beijingensis]